MCSAGGVSGCEVNRAAPGCHVPGPWFHPVALRLNAVACGTVRPPRLTRLPLSPHRAASPPSLTRPPARSPPPPCPSARRGPRPGRRRGCAARAAAPRSAVGTPPAWPPTRPTGPGCSAGRRRQPLASQSPRPGPCPRGPAQHTVLKKLFLEWERAHSEVHTAHLQLCELP